MDGSSDNANSQSSGVALKGKSDIAWNHVAEIVGANGKQSWKCLYCGKVTQGGGINRIKQHLAGVGKEIKACKKCPSDISIQMKESLSATSEKKRKEQDHFEVDNPYGPSSTPFEGDDVEIEEIPCPNKTFPTASKPNTSGKGKQPKLVGDFFAPRTTPGSQPTLKSVLASKEAISRVHLEVAKFFYDACIPINAVNSVYFQRMFDAALAIGPGFKVPTYHELRVPLLRDAKKEVQLFVDSLKYRWAEYGCTIMGDGWTDTRQRSLINFLVYCPRGTVFIKSVDASDVIKDARTLFELFKEVIEWVGPKVVVHLVTDNGANYVAARRLVHGAYKNINWSLCAAHCLNLVMQDIANLENVKTLAKKASAITKFVYNHGYWLNWLRKRKDWTEIVRPGATRFATTFIALYNVHNHMHDLKALVTCKEFCDSKLYKDKKTKDVVATVLDQKFWSDCLIIVKVVDPLMRLLRIVDGDRKPSIGYVFEGMYRAQKAIKEFFRHKKRYYKVYTSIIKRRWDQQLRKDIHAAAYWFNPAFQYDQENFCKKPFVMDVVLDIFTDKGEGSSSVLLYESRLFRDRLGSFGRDLAFETCKKTQPDEWWRLFGHSTPNLQKLAIRILGQTSSSSGCERNWSVFERIHAKKRNRLEHQRLNDLVFVHYNLKLKDRYHAKEKDYDPIDYESIDKIDFWVFEEEEDQLFNDQEIEKLLYEDLEPPHLRKQGRRGREGVDDEEEDMLITQRLDDDGDEDMLFSSFHGDLDLHLYDVALGYDDISGSTGSTSGGHTSFGS